jgi:hypothetical protein
MHEQFGISHVTVQVEPRALYTIGTEPLTAGGSGRRTAADPQPRNDT